MELGHRSCFISTETVDFLGNHQRDKQMQKHRGGIQIL